MKVCFLIHSLYGVGGTIRTTLTTAGALADLGYDVEIATVFRRRGTPRFAVDRRLRVTPLIDLRRRSRPAGRSWWRDRMIGLLWRLPSMVVPSAEVRGAQYNRYVDARVKRFLRGCDADVIIGTRPALNLYLARYAPRGAVTIGQEHSYLKAHRRRLARAIGRRYPGLDAISTVAGNDAEHYRRQWPKLAQKVVSIPNAVPPTDLPPSTGDTRTIVAAGRLTRGKGFELLLDAFAMVAPRHPGWQLRIYGSGSRRRRLLSRVHHRGLHNSVLLMGSRVPMDAEWVKGSIAAVSSRFEPFGLTIVEAMDAGLPVVAADCDYGPREIITDGVDGLLVPAGDTEAFAEALDRLMTDDRLRARMSAAARRTATGYAPRRVGLAYDELIARLRGTARSRILAPAAVAAGTEPCVTARARSFTELDLQFPAAARIDPLALRHDDESVRLNAPEPNGHHRFVGIDAARTPIPASGIWLLRADDRPVAADRIDTRSLLHAPAPTAGISMVPFDHHGTFALRVWHQRVFAEVGELFWSGADLDVSGTVHGARPRAGEAVIRLRLRDRPDVELRTAAFLSPHGAFDVRIPARVLAALRPIGEHDLWDVWLSCPGHDEPGIRVGRVLDDVARRKGLHTYPPSNPDAEAAAELRVRPYYTVANYLSLRVTAT